MTPAAIPEAPCEAFFFDVETMDASEEAVDRDFAENYETPKSYKDQEAIERHKADARVKWTEKAALLDAAPVAMVGLMFERKTFLLHGLKNERGKWFGRNGERNQVWIEGFAGEKLLMEMVCKVITRFTGAETRGVGHNIFGFDLGKLRLAIVRNGLALPEFFRVLTLEDEERQQFVDTMKLYTRYFAKSGQMFIKLEAMAENLGIDVPLKGIATGEDVPKLLAAGKITAVAAKNLSDLVVVREAFLRMTGRTRG